MCYSIFLQMWRLFQNPVVEWSIIKMFYKAKIYFFSKKMRKIISCFCSFFYVLFRESYLFFIHIFLLMNNIYWRKNVFVSGIIQSILLRHFRLFLIYFLYKFNEDHQKKVMAEKIAKMLLFGEKRRKRFIYIT